VCASRETQLTQAFVDAADTLTDDFDITAFLHALPMRLRSTVIGVLNLFRAHPGSLGDADIRTGQALADIATIGILAQRNLHQAALLTAQLQAALNSRVIIEQAKGVLAEHHRITLDEAFTLLRAYSRNHNRRLSDIARDVAARALAAGELLSHQPAPAALASADRP
jgi:ANTAR domain